MPAHGCLHPRLHLHTCMCYTGTLTHEHMHTQILGSPDVCFHRHQPDSCTLNPKNAACWCYSEAHRNGVHARMRDGRAHVSLAEATPGCPDTAFTSTLLSSAQFLLSRTFHHAFYNLLQTCEKLSVVNFFFCDSFSSQVRAVILAFLKAPKLLRVAHLFLPDPDAFIATLSFQYGLPLNDISVYFGKPFELDKCCGRQREESRSSLGGVSSQVCSGMCKVHSSLLLSF